MSRPTIRTAALVFFFLSVFSTQASHANDVQQLRQMAQLAEYIGVDYAEAIDDGAIINQGEYDEMLEFSQLLLERTTAGDSPALQKQAKALKQAVIGKQELTRIQELSSQLRNSLLDKMPQSSLPHQLLSSADNKALYQTSCSSCHGVNGAGDGPAAKGLDPGPTDFTDNTRAMNRSVLGLFDAISNGIDDTAMSAFPQMSEQQRWSLAFYVGGLAFADKSAKATDKNINLLDLVNHNPNQILKENPDLTIEDISYARSQPDALFFKQQNKSPLAVTRTYLLKAQQAHQQADYKSAANLAITAYLDGFELAENSLDAHDQKLRRGIEKNMMHLRQLFKSPQNNGQLDEVLDNTLTQLDDAQHLLSEGSLSDATLFSASFVILLREGLEALLVVIALITILIQSQRRSALKYVHFGWISALLAGGATWVAAQTLIEISGASREIMEGVAALLAAAVLLYVGVWMHSKSSAAQWQSYIQKQVNKHLDAGALWGLAGLSFVAVYREVFETVLFYQSLLTQVGPEQYSSVAGGFVAAVVALALVAWALLRYSVKLPIATFFAITTYVLVALAFVLAGKAVSALQEAGLLDIASMPIDFQFGWLGVNSTWQGVSAQAAVIAIFLVFMLIAKKKNTQS